MRITILLKWNDYSAVSTEHFLAIDLEIKYPRNSICQMPASSILSSSGCKSEHCLFNWHSKTGLRWISRCNVRTLCIQMGMSHGERQIKLCDPRNEMTLKRNIYFNWRQNDSILLLWPCIGSDAGERARVRLHRIKIVCEIVIIGNRSR